MSTGMLHDKVALIIGGAGGIGRAAAKLFAAEGAVVFVSDRDPETTEQAAVEIGARSHMAADVTSGDQVEAVVAHVLEAAGRLDCAFNAAGVVGHLAPLETYGDETWEHVQAVNVRGVYNALKAQLPAMRRGGGGAIVNAASAAGVLGSPQMSAYGASKWAVVGMTKSAALECAGDGIRVNAVLPGTIDTGMSRGLTADAPEKWGHLVEATPMKRVGQANEVAEAAAWLCSERSSYITGHGLVIDGGYSVG